MTAQPDFIDKLHSIWDKFVADVSDVIRMAEPDARDDVEKAADAAEAAAVHDLDRVEPQSNITAPPESSTPADSSVPVEEPEPAAPAAPVEEPPSNIAPTEDQTGDTVAAAAGTLPAQVPVEVETFGPGATPAESVSLGTTTATIPVVTDPQAAADAAQAEANAHPTVTGQVPMPDDVAQWLAANGLKTEPA